jgi:DNA-directed RNA polymerase specialized sigma24 family protein
MEKALIEAVLNKKKSAFSIFYNDIVDHFFSFLKSSYNLSNEEINDIIADTFIKIWTKLDSFNKDK